VHAKKIALIGASGFVGKTLAKVLQKTPHDVALVTRTNYEQFKAGNYDIIIHSAMPSKRWWAANNPLDDFDATVRLTAEILYNWKFEKLVLISSVSARIQTSHPYGRHKHVAEVLVLDYNPNHLVFRLGGLYGEGLDKGVIFDMMNGNEVFMTEDSAFNYIDTLKASELIIDRLDKKGIVDVGAKDSISIGKIAGHFGWDVKFGNRYEFQNTENPDTDYPNADEVLKYLAELKKQKI
jgi:nucleoside-diphosphate-sugar epimerase